MGDTYGPTGVWQPTQSSTPVEGIRDAATWWSEVAQRVIGLLDRADAQGYVEVEFDLFGKRRIKILLPPKVSQ